MAPLAIVENRFLFGLCQLHLLPFEQQIEDKIWINSGVIGMPANDGTPRTWYATVHNNGSSIKAKLHALEYQHSRASVKMIDQKLPKTYASTLNSGIWDNCEILPKQETSEQGQPLSFEG